MHVYTYSCIAIDQLQDGVVLAMWGGDWQPNAPRPLQRGEVQRKAIYDGKCCGVHDSLGGHNLRYGAVLLPDALQSVGLRNGGCRLHNKPPFLLLFLLRSGGGRLCAQLRAVRNEYLNIRSDVSSNVAILASVHDIPPLCHTA